MWKQGITMNFIKDTDCTVDTPVTYGKEERPVYGREVRFRPRVPGKRETATDKKNYLPRLLPLEDYDLIIVLFSGGKDSLAAYLKLLEWGVPKEKIELWHHDIDGGHPDRKMDWPVTQSYVEALTLIYQSVLKWDYSITWKTTFKEGGSILNLSNMFPASGDLAAQIKKPVATAVAKPTDNKAVGSSLADCMQTRKRPGEWAIKWPKLRKQGFKDYRPLLTIQEVIDYCNRCEETGLGGFDYETSGDKDHRIPPTDEDGNTVTGKALDSWTRDVNLDPWKAEVCAMSLSAACDEARAIFIDNPGANQFEPGLSRSEARKRLFDTLEQYFFTNHKIVKIAVNMNFETKFTAKYGKYILMPCADPFIAWIRLSQLLLPNKIKNPKRPYVGKGLKPMTKEVFGVQMSEFTSVLERNQALFFDQVPNDEHDALSYCCEDSDYAVQHYLYWDEVAKQISNDNEVYPTYSDWLKNIEMPFTRVTGIMEYWGMKWDSDIAQVKREEAKNAIEIAAQTMKDLAASVGIKDLMAGVRYTAGFCDCFIKYSKSFLFNHRRLSPVSISPACTYLVLVTASLSSTDITAL